MTATSPAAPPYQEPAARPVPGRAGFGNLLASEWTKIRSVRSTVWSLILLVVVTLGFTALFTWLSVYNWDKTDPAQRAQAPPTRSARSSAPGSSLGSSPSASSACS
jgi:hypothetical protein